MMNMSRSFSTLTNGMNNLVISQPTLIIRNYARPLIPPYVHPNPLNPVLPAMSRPKAKRAIFKFKAERAKKVMKVTLPNFHEKSAEDMTPAEIREKTKKVGIQPHRSWSERTIYIASTGTTFEAYVPPEGDGKAALLSEKGVKQSYEFLTKKGKSTMALRKVRRYEDDFNLHKFTEEALQIYIDLHKALTEYDEDEIHNLATERIFTAVLNDAKGKQIKWSFLGSLEPPRVVQVRHTSALTEENQFAQITVRFHTQQLLAVYDRFGRLMHGSDVVAKDVLEYVVFEKNITNTYGIWRVHDKIIPEWMKLRPASFITYKEEKPKSDSKSTTPVTSPTTKQPEDLKEGKLSLAT